MASDILYNIYLNGILNYFPRQYWRLLKQGFRVGTFLGGFGRQNFCLCNQELKNFDSSFKKSPEAGYKNQVGNICNKTLIISINNTTEAGLCWLSRESKKVDRPLTPFKKYSYEKFHTTETHIHMILITSFSFEKVLFIPKITFKSALFNTKGTI